MRGKINTTLQKNVGEVGVKHVFEIFFNCLSRTTGFVILCISSKLGALVRQAEEQAFCSSRVPTDKTRVYLFEKSLLFNWHLYVCWPWGRRGVRWRKATHTRAVGMVLGMEAGCLCGWWCFPCTLNEKRVETLCPLAVQHWMCNMD